MIQSLKILLINTYRRNIVGSIRRIGIFIGRKGAIWLAVMILGSFLLVLAEFGVAAFIQVFLASSGLMEKDLISPRLAPLVGYGTTTIVALLLILGVFRGLATLMAQSGSFLFGELVSLRLKVTTVYELLLSPESGKLSGSQVNTRLGEVFPKAINFIAGVSSSLILAIQVLTLLGVLFFDRVERSFNRISWYHPDRTWHSKVKPICCKTYQNPTCHPCVNDRDDRTSYTKFFVCHHIGDKGKGVPGLPEASRKVF